VRYLVYFEIPAEVGNRLDFEEADLDQSSDMSWIGSRQRRRTHRPACAVFS
jgi:hypothetical protein